MFIVWALLLLANRTQLGIFFRRASTVPGGSLAKTEMGLCQAISVLKLPAATAVSTIFYIDCDDGNSEIIEVTACTP
jgi:hypothetical protein